MLPQDVKEFYDTQYKSHRDGRVTCPNSLHDLEKAQRRVKSVIRAFGISNCFQGAEVLDVGCGLGYYTKALSSTGAKVTGIDISAVGLEAARSTFPECQFRCAAWHEDIEKKPQFDLVWAVSLSVINTFDVHAINERYIVEAVERLKPNGCVVLGWHTDFSGRTLGNWSHWTIGMLRRMRQVCGLSEPIVPEARTRWLSWLMIYSGFFLRRGVPIFMARKKNDAPTR